MRHTPNPKRIVLPTTGSASVSHGTAVTTTLSKAGPSPLLSRLAKESMLLLLVATKLKVWGDHPILVLVFPVVSKVKSWELLPADSLNVLIVGDASGLPAKSKLTEY